MSDASTIDHDALWRNTLATLASLSSLRLSRYQIKTISGSEVFVGGFGDVEKAELRESFFFGSNPVVALKRLRPSGDRAQRIRVIASLARELYVWSRLRHSNILPLGGFYFDEVSLTTAWITTRWQKNGNILKYVEATKADMNTRRKLALDTARGLAYLHGLSPPVCHADIKAENTLVNDSGDAVLCDFGLARILEDVPSGLTTTTTRGCTLRYAAPELITGDGSSHSLASDVWAWGCLLLVILTGALPYVTKDRDTAIIVAISQQVAPADLSSDSHDMPGYVRSILTACWKQEREKRPTMIWCRAALRAKTVDPFENIYSSGFLKLDGDIAWMLTSLASRCVSNSSVEAFSSGTYESRGPVLRAKIRDPTFDHGSPVLVKVIRPAEDWNQSVGVLDALIKELYTWNRVRHDNILPLQGFYFDKSSPTSSLWIITPWLTHGNVSHYVKAKKADMDERLKLALDIAHGLAYLHNRSPPICHGNLDIEKVLVDTKGNAQIGGFGLTRRQNLGQVPTVFVAMNSFIFALRYSPPEAVARHPPIRIVEGDMWALGCVLLEVVTDVPPYTGKEGIVDILRSFIEKELPADPGSVSGSLEPPDYIRYILSSCWEYRPWRRCSINRCREVLWFRATDRDIIKDTHSTASHAESLQLPDHTASMLATLASLRVSRSSVEMCSNDELQDGRFGPVLKAKIGLPGLHNTSTVAVKVLRSTENWNQRLDVLDAWIQELSVWNSIQHQNILPLQGFYFDASSLASPAWIITSWEPRGTVPTYVKDEKPDLDVRLNMALDIADGLAYLHNLSPPIYHGNLDADGILIDARGHARIGGFGFRRALRGFTNEFPPSGVRDSRLRYASPELVALDGPTSSREGDIWAWGCVLLVVITDILPYAYSTEGTAIWDAICRGEPPVDTSSIPAPRFISKLLDLCWEQVPASRLGISGCRTMLSLKAVEPFGLYTKIPVDSIPLQCRSEGAGWQAIFNPDSKKVYHFELRLHVGYIPGNGAPYISPDGSQIALADKAVLSLYDTVTGSMLSAWYTAGHSSPKNVLGEPPSRLKSNYLPAADITATCFNPKGSLLATGHSNGAVRLWNLTSRTLQRELIGDQNPINSMTFGNSNVILRSASDCKTSIGADGDTSICTWDVEAGVLQHTSPLRRRCRLIGTPRHGSIVAVGSSNGSGVVCNTQDGTCFRIQEAGDVSSLTPDASYLITTSLKDGVALTAWGLPPVRGVHEEGKSERGAHSVSPSISDTEESRGWPELDGESFHGPQTQIDSLSISSDGLLAASGSSKNGDLFLWDVETRLPVVKIWGEQFRHIRDVTFRPGSTTLEGCLFYSCHEAPGESPLGRQLLFLRYTLAS